MKGDINMQNDVIRAMIQKEIPDRKVRTIWYLATDIQNNILYGISGNNNTFFAVAKISPTGEVEVIR